MDDKQKQQYLHLATWWIGRIYTRQFKGEKTNGIGAGELLAYIAFRPDFTVPPDEPFDHQGHYNLVKGKNGYEVYPATIDVEETVAADPATHLFLVPASAVEESFGKYFVLVSIGKNGINRQEVKLESSRKSGDGRFLVKSGLRAGDKIIIKKAHPQAGQLMMAPIPTATSKEWDRFSYFCRLIHRAKQEIWATQEKNEAKLSQLKIKVAEIFARASIVKSLPELS